MRCLTKDEYGASRARRMLTGNILTPTVTERGYLRVILSDVPRRVKHLKVHRLVFAAFNPGVAFTELNHKNLDKTDNRPENLEPSDRKHNQAHAKANGRYVRPRMERPTKACAHCGKVFTQPMRGGNSSPKCWAAARFCSRACSNIHNFSVS